MSYMDDIEENAMSMSEMQARFDELRSMEMRGELDEQGKEELTRLRKQFGQM